MKWKSPFFLPDSFVPRPISLAFDPDSWIASRKFWLFNPQGYVLDPNPICGPQHLELAFGAPCTRIGSVLGRKRMSCKRATVLGRVVEEDAPCCVGTSAPAHGHWLRSYNLTQLYFPTGACRSWQISSIILRVLHEPLSTKNTESCLKQDLKEAYQGGWLEEPCNISAPLSKHTLPLTTKTIIFVGYL